VEGIIVAGKDLLRTLLNEDEVENAATAVLGCKRNDDF
jgi:hypothetical protein